MNLADLQQSFVGAIEKIVSSSAAATDEAQTVKSLGQLLFLQKIILAYISHDFVNSQTLFFPTKLGELLNQYQSGLSQEQRQKLSELIIVNLTVAAEEFGVKLGQQLDEPTRQKLASEIKQQVSQLNTVVTNPI